MQSLTTLLLAATLLISGAGMAGEKDVNVVNTPDVNVAGPVQVDDDPPVAVDTGEDPVLPDEILSLAISGVDCSIPDVGVVGKGFQRVFADGGLAGSFAVPAGHAFVVTSVQSSSLASTAGIAVRFVLKRAGPGASGRGALVSHATADGDGTAFGSESLPTGVVFGPGTEPCASVSSPGPAGFGETPFLSAVRLQGYLTANN